MKTRVITQTLYIKIFSPSWVASGHGYHDLIEEKIWYEGPYQSEEHIQEVMEYAKEEIKGSWIASPKILYQWKDD